MPRCRANVPIDCVGLLGATFNIVTDKDNTHYYFVRRNTSITRLDWNTTVDDIKTTIVVRGKPPKKSIDELTIADQTLVQLAINRWCDEFPMTCW